MNLQYPFASPVRFTGLLPKNSIQSFESCVFCREDLFRPTRQEHFFEFQRGVRSVGDLPLEVAREKYDRIDVAWLLLGRNETPVNQEPVCVCQPRQFKPRRSLRISRLWRGVPEPKRNVTSASVAK